jgi:hypothetical protein
MTAAKGRYFRFEDPGVQAEFIQALDRATVAYRRGDDGAVMFDEVNAVAVMKAVNRVRDAQFPWYLLNWKTEAEADRYRDVLNAEGLTFIAERQETGTWFLVKREDRARHDELWAQILDKEGDVSDL